MISANRKSAVGTPIVLLVPASFDAHAMLPTEMLHLADRAYYLLDLILRRKMRWKADADGFVRLNAQLLRKQLGHWHALPLVQALERLKVIERREDYLVGRQCMGYRTLPPYSTDEVRRVRFEDEGVLEFLAEWWKETHCRKADVHWFLDDWVTHIGIQVEPARRIVRQTPRLARDITTWYAAIDAIASGEALTSVCRMGRYHTIFSRMPRELRSCITIDGVAEPLAQVDVSNCQPLMIALIVGLYEAALTALRARMRMGSLFESARRNPYIAIAGNKRANGEPGSPVLILRAESGELRQRHPVTGVAPAPAGLKRDAILYLELCESGAIYEHLQRELHMKDRETVKQRFVEMAGKADWSRGFDRGFNDLFPSVARVMKLIQKQNHRQLARLTQNIEATLVIDRAVGRIMKFGDANLPILTVHDGIFTRPQCLPRVEAALRDVFREVGLAVRLKRDHVATVKGR